MLPSSTVENYLKAIHHGQSSLPKGQRLLPMGHVAAALSVTPGTATTMVKALAESGLVEYEPYSGVRLSKAGDNLLTCPTGTILKVTRITDQDPAFLRFVESNHLKPGQRIEVEARDTAADAVRLRGANREPLTIGARAASKLLVEVCVFE